MWVGVGVAKFAYQWKHIISKEEDAESEYEGEKEDKETLSICESYLSLKMTISSLRKK